MMKSKITIEVDFNTATPFIQVVLDPTSEDLRDRALNNFRHKLTPLSTWCHVRFDDTGVSGSKTFTIEPILPADLPYHLEMMQKTVQSFEQNNLPIQK